MGWDGLSLSLFLAQEGEKRDGLELLYQTSFFYNGKVRILEFLEFGGSLMTAKNIGEFIQKLRKEKGLTQRELA